MDWKPLLDFLRDCTGNQPLTEAELLLAEATLGEKIENGDYNIN